MKLTDKKIEWAVKQVINKGETTEMVAAIYVKEKNTAIGEVL